MNNEYKNIFDLLEPLARDLIFEGGIIRGELTADENILNSLSCLQEYDDFLQLSITRSCPPNILSRIQNGESFGISVELIRSRGHFFGLNLTDLLSSEGGRYCQELPAGSLYLIEESWKSWESDSHESRQSVSVNAYYKVIEFVSFLKSHVANHSDGQKIHLFGNDENLVIPIKYNASVIEENSKSILDSLAQINLIVGSDAHKEDKHKQLKYVLIDHLKTVSQKDRFNSLLSNISEIAHRFHHNYELFISGFSFEDNKEQLKKENREYTEKLNLVIESIHSRIVSIPAGTVIPALLMKSEKVGALGLEWLIFFTSIFLVAVIAASLHNQWILLQKVRTEYSEKWSRMKSQIPKLMCDLENEYRDLEKSYKRNRNLIVIFSGSLFIFFLAPLSILVYP